MPQFRLTQKFANDCKIKQLGDPTTITNPLDDWFVDRIIVDRKKIAMITHAKSAYTFFIPYANAGGAKKITPFFLNLLKELFHHHALLTLAEEVEKISMQNTAFTKTVDRKILGHMNDFRRCAEPYPGDPYPVDWQDTADRINNMPVKGDGRDWLYPIERFNALLGIKLPKRHA